jgi:hypothetical protein
MNTIKFAFCGCPFISFKSQDPKKSPKISDTRVLACPKSQKPIIPKWHVVPMRATKRRHAAHSSYNWFQTVGKRPISASTTHKTLSLPSALLELRRTVSEREGARSRLAPRLEQCWLGSWGWIMALHPPKQGEDGKNKKSNLKPSETVPASPAARVRGRHPSRASTVRGDSEKEGGREGGI